jgi:RNA polymerase sigma-70 factor (ECF subfamily)
MTSSVPSPTAVPRRRFATTRWSLIHQARQGHDTPAKAALEELYEAYWLPVYGFMRRQTRDVHEAQDWTQGFFASLLARDAFADLNPEFGRFRSFLLAAARHFVSNERDRKATLSRGGKMVLHSLDFDRGEEQLVDELARGETPEQLFERRWALALLDRALNRLRLEHQDAGRAELFAVLANHLAGQPTEATLTEVAESLQMSPEAVRIALHRLRKRYRRILQSEIAETVSSPDGIDDEIRCLFLALRVV